MYNVAWIKRYSNQNIRKLEIATMSVTSVYAMAMVSFYYRGSNSLATTVATANMHENIRIMNISQYTFDKNLSFLL